MGSESYELKVTMLENLASERRSDFERDSKASNSCFPGCFLYNRFQKISGFWSLYECPLLAISGPSARPWFRSALPSKADLFQHRRLCLVL